jgi:hypothetical protein
VGRGRAAGDVDVGYRRDDPHRAFGEAAGGGHLEAHVRLSPLECYLDETGEPLAALLRAGNAGSNTAEDHVRVLELALAQLPQQDLDRPVLVRTDTGGCSHEFIAACRETDIRYSVGYELDDRVRQAVVTVKESRWIEAIEPDGGPRDGAWVAEVSEHLDLSAWGQGARLIVRRERPHPGAQFTIIDEHGYRYTCFITDQADRDIAVLELRHRRRARVEDRIRTGKDTGMRNLPHHAFAHNQTWLEISLIAQELLCWMRLLCLDGHLALAEPKKLRHRLLHVAGRLAHHGRRTRLRLQSEWPWTQALVAAFTKLRSIPAPC